jgi:hypothetical protein
MKEPIDYKLEVIDNQIKRLEKITDKLSSSISVILAILPGALMVLLVITICVLMKKSGS